MRSMGKPNYLTAEQVEVIGFSHRVKGAAMAIRQRACVLCCYRSPHGIAAL